jgi:hypothetical protein
MSSIGFVCAISRETKAAAGFAKFFAEGVIYGIMKKPPTGPPSISLVH